MEAGTASLGIRQNLTDTSEFWGSHPALNGVTVATQ